MASSFNRKSNSSASRASKPTFRRAPRVLPSGAGSPNARVIRPAGGSGRVSLGSPVPVRSVSTRPMRLMSGAGARPQAGSGRSSAAGAPAPAMRSGGSSSRALGRVVSPRPVGQRLDGGAGRGVARSSRRGSVASGSAGGQRRSPSRLSLIVGCVAVLALALVIAGVTIINAGVFAATDVTIKGSEHLSAAAAKRLIDLPDDLTLLNVNDKQITADLQSNPWIDGVDIQRTWPHGLTITPRERKVAAVAYISSDDIAWAIGEDDTWIAPISLSVMVDANGKVLATGAEAQAAASAAAQGSANGSANDGSAASSGDTGAASDSTDSGSTGTNADGGSGTSGSTGSSDAAKTEQGTTSSQGATANADGSTYLTGESAARVLAKHAGAVLLIDVSADVAPSSGKNVTSRAVLAGLKYAKGFSATMRDRIKDLSVGSVESIAANLTDGVEVSLGDASDIKTKEQVVLKLLDQVHGVTYINVRTPNAYTYRSVPDGS